jgi:probable rRNA maturation factor
MIWEGFSALPFVLEKKVIVLEHKTRVVSVRALSLFAAKARRALGLQGEVNVRVTSNRDLQELNRRFRRKDKPTDVLSFPSDIPKLAGDIAISADIAVANAAEIGHPPETELKILILHGMLHLAGYDHEIDKGAMQARETALRQQLGLPSGLIERAHSKRRPRTGKVAGRTVARKPQGSRK